MADRLTPEERRLIEEAAASGKITRVAPGASSAQLEQVYSPERGRVVSVATAQGNTTKPTMKWGRRKGSVSPHVRERRARLRELHAQGLDCREIAIGMQILESTVRAELSKMGLKPNPMVRRKNAGDVQAEKKIERAAEKVAEVKDRRRFKATPVPTGKPSKTTGAEQSGTLFPGKVIQPNPREAVLKGGANNCKVGGDVLIGWMKGAKIFTLTLEERATCPRSCQLWGACYGNGMQHAIRWKAGPDLEARLQAEVPKLCLMHERVLVRLHVLGDFYSIDYLRVWVELLDDFPNLAVYGFTAHLPGTEIGDAIGRVRAALGHRFAIRHSGVAREWGAFTIDFPTARKQLGDAIVCPEQVDAMAGGESKRHCGSCAACWSCENPIVFVEH